MAIAPEFVHDIFRGLENGDGAAFLEHVADNSDRTIRAYLDSAMVTQLFEENPLA